MNQGAKHKLMEAVISSVLPQQVPDAEILSGRADFAQFELAHDGLGALPDIVAYSTHHETLFFIHVGAIGNDRRAELHNWSSRVTRHTAHVSAFASRKDYVAHMHEQAVETFAWFADEPKHHLFISGSPEASAEFLTARFAAK